MKKFTIPWMAWYGDGQATFAVPDSWELAIAKMPDVEDIGDAGIEKAFGNPIGSARLRDLASRRSKVAIAIDDIARPTKADRLVPIILKDLEDAGIQGENVKIVMALGAHRAMHRLDLIKKLGENIYHTVDVHQHNPFENLVNLGVSSRGTPIHINRLFWESDLKIGVGCIIPHAYAGYSGGAKIVLPGLSGIDTLEKNHLPVVTGTTCGVGLVDGHEGREDIEEIGRKVGLDVIVNVVVNYRRDIAGCFVGDPVDAHRAGVQFAKSAYRTPVPEEPVDVVILNAFPKDTDLIQCEDAFNILLSSKREIIKKSGTIILIGACIEGAGWHFLRGVGNRLYGKWDADPFMARFLRGKKLYVFSPYLSHGDAAQYLTLDSEKKNAIFTRSWDSLIDELAVEHRECSVLVFPTGPLQIADN